MRRVIVVALLALPVGWIAFAQPEKGLDPSKKNSLRSEQLGPLLKEMKLDSGPLAAGVSQISLEHDGWKVHIMISIPGDGDRIWLESKFAQIEKPDLVPAAAWRKLLEENERISPSHFSFDKMDKRVHLHRAFRNVDVSSERLKKEIERFDEIVRQTHDSWRAENFSVPKDPMDGLKGKWYIVRFVVNGESLPEEMLRDAKSPDQRSTVIIEDNLATIRLGAEKPRIYKVKIDPARNPKQIDFISDNAVELGIYNFQTGLLSLRFSGKGEPRPQKFETDDKNNHFKMVLRKE